MPCPRRRPRSTPTGPRRARRTGWCWSASARTWAAFPRASRCRTPGAISAAGSARATAPTTTPPAAYAKARRRATWRCRPTSSCPTPRSRSAEEPPEMAAHHESTYRPTTRVGKWLDERLPLPRLMHGQFVDFPTPRNINYLWTTGGLLTFFLAVQIATGIVLAMHFVPSASDAFNSVEHIRRDVNYGWLIRNPHAVGPALFLLALHAP